MNRLLSALWDRLLAPGGDVAVAREPRPLRVHWLGYRPEPRRLGDASPEPHELGPYGHCWWWNAMGRSWTLCHARNLEPGDIWLPYSAIADPSAEP
ncbi:MAG: hypothetical protein ACO218_07755 [Steroidobacteraceae bacterium]